MSIIDRLADFLTVDLNSLPYKTEADLAAVLDEEFGGGLRLSNGGREEASRWTLPGQGPPRRGGAIRGAGSLTARGSRKEKK